MKALILEQYNQPFQQVEIKKPAIGKGQVLVKIKASGINPLDLKIKQGKGEHAQQKLPAILGIDLAGIVEEAGEGVTIFKPGDKVYGMTGGIGGNQGSLAEYAAVDPALLALKPANLTMRQAAAIPLVFITAWEGLVDRAHVHSGQTVLIQGGSGGVGHMAVQIAVAKGAKVFTTDSLKNHEFIKSLGATPIDYHTATVEEYIEKYTAGEGFDIVYDTVGGATLDDSFKAAKIYQGHVVSSLGWGTHSLAPLSFRGATYSGIFTLLPLLTGKGRKHHGEIIAEATRLAQAGKLIPLLDPEFYTLGTIEHAYEALENKAARGKVVIDI